MQNYAGVLFKFKLACFITSEYSLQIKSWAASENVESSCNLPQLIIDEYVTTKDILREINWQHQSQLQIFLTR